ncbi:MAG: EamA family transporter [Elainellaceae cyanobacterium]
MSTQINALRGGRLGLLLIVCSAVLWGTVGVFVQTIYQLTETNPLSIGFFRLAISVPTLFLVCFYRLGWGMFQIARREFILMLLIGALTAFYQVCYFAAITYVGVAAATLITLCTAPVWVALLASRLLREPLTWGITLAGMLAIGGTALLIGLQSAQGAMRSSALLGVGLALSSALGYACVTLGSRLLAGRYHPLQTLTVSFAAGAALLLPVALMAGLVVHYPIAGWMSLLYLGIVTTAFAYLLYFRGIRHLSATTASIAALFEPLTSTVLAWWLFQEQLGESGPLGALMLLAAIGILYWENLRCSATRTD